jgi:fructose-1,6-bisphosphatase I
MSFLIEQAGGASVNGKERILSLPSAQLHQRVSVVLGSKNEVALIQKYHLEK